MDGWLDQGKLLLLLYDVDVARDCGMTVSWHSYRPSIMVVGSEVSEKEKAPIDVECGWWSN